MVSKCSKPVVNIARERYSATVEDALMQRLLIVWGCFDKSEKLWFTTIDLFRRNLVSSGIYSVKSMYLDLW
jgi:hypothetical protein